MRKALILLLLTCTLLTACGKKDTSAVELPPNESANHDDLTATPEAQLAEDHEEEPVEEATEEVIIDDPMAIYKTDRLVAGAFGSIAAYIKRGDTYYGVSFFDLTNPNNEALPYGFLGTPLFHIVKGKDEGAIYCSHGGPMFTIEPGDELIAVSENNVPELRLDKMEQTGYTIPLAIRGEVGISYIYDYRTKKTVFLSDLYNKADIKVWDFDKGKLIYHETIDSFGATEIVVGEEEDLTKLEYAVEYKVSVTQGTTAKEWFFVADLPTYSFVTGAKRDEVRYVGGKSQPDYVLTGTPTSSGYATYDFSDIPPGLYALGWVVIEIR